MNLNAALPAALAEKLKKHTELETIYCMRTDIGNDGMFTKDCWLGATEKENTDIYKIKGRQCLPFLFGFI